MALIFPDSLKERSAYPIVRFSVNNAPGSQSICLPIPQGLAFGDNMNYSTVDLGLIGDVGKQAVEALNKEGLSGAAFSSMGGMLMGKMGSINKEAAALIAAKATGSEALQQVVGLGIKKILAPNTNSLFQGSAIRQFGFQFKLVSRTESEAKTAKEIVDTFRKYMYPEGTSDNILLSYPNTWNIGFDRANLPKIMQCYLTSLSSTYNSSTNAFYKDDSPLEVDVSITFQEVRALNRSDLYP